MYNLSDYVRWVAESMGRSLSNESIKEITYNLLESEKYKEMLRELEDEIIEHSKKWSNK